MPLLRLFGPAREAAGTSCCQLDGETVGQVVDAACARFGDPLRQVLSLSALWVNGEPSDSATAVADADEVAVIPPVSGGC